MLQGKHLNDLLIRLKKEANSCLSEPCEQNYQANDCLIVMEGKLQDNTKLFYLPSFLAVTSSGYKTDYNLNNIIPTLFFPFLR